VLLGNVSCSSKSLLDVQWNVVVVKHIQLMQKNCQKQKVQKFNSKQSGQRRRKAASTMNDFTDGHNDKMTSLVDAT
jgi:hypothetical protein